MEESSPSSRAAKKVLQQLAQATSELGESELHEFAHTEELTNFFERIAGCWTHEGARALLRRAGHSITVGQDPPASELIAPAQGKHEMLTPSLSAPPPAALPTHSPSKSPSGLPSALRSRSPSPLPAILAPVLRSSSRSPTNLRSPLPLSSALPTHSPSHLLLRSRSCSLTPLAMPSGISSPVPDVLPARSVSPFSSPLSSLPSSLPLSEMDESDGSGDEEGQADGQDADDGSDDDSGDEEGQMDADGVNESDGESNYDSSDEEGETDADADNESDDKSADEIDNKIYDEIDQDSDSDSDSDSDDTGDEATNHDKIVDSEMLAESSSKVHQLALGSSPIASSVALARHRSHHAKPILGKTDLGKRPAEDVPPEEPGPKRAMPSTSHPSLLPAASPLPEDLPVSQVSVDGGLAADLFTEFTDAENIVQALELLCFLSGNDEPGSAMGLVASKGLNLFSAGAGKADIPSRMIDASRWAQSHLKNAERDLAFVRIKTLMSYITLFLTMEHVIVPRIRAENRDWGVRQVDGEKFRYFHKLLNETTEAPASSANDVVVPATTENAAYPPPQIAATSSQATSPIPSLDAAASTGSVPQGKITKLRDHITYGKKFWTFGQELGISAFLMFAVCGTGLTKIAKLSEKKTGIIRKLATELSTSKVWWAFANGIGPHACRTLFGEAIAPHTIAELLHHIRAEPIPAVSIGQIFEKCAEKGIETRFQTAIVATDPVASSSQSLDPPSSHDSSPSVMTIAIGDSTIFVNTGACHLNTGHSNR